MEKEELGARGCGDGAKKGEGEQKVRNGMHLACSEHNYGVESGALQ